MKTFLKKSVAMLVAVLLFIAGSQTFAFAQGETSQSLSISQVIGGVALVIGLVVLLAVKQGPRISNHN